MVVCGVLLAVGIVLAIMWNGERFTPPVVRHEHGGVETMRHRDGLRLYVWWASVYTVAGMATWILIVGAGGRLAMRLLAITSPDATNKITEAGEVVGEITVGGTIAYFIFGAFMPALLAALLYLAVEPWLPRGRLGGPAYGALLLIVLAPLVDPLRSENLDFTIVGPGWMSVVVFSAMVILEGTALASIAGRVSRSLPLMSRNNLGRTAPPLVPAVVVFPFGLALLAVAFVTLAFPRLLPWVLALRASRWGVIVGRSVLALAVILAAPTFVRTAVSIWTA